MYAQHLQPRPHLRFMQEEAASQHAQEAAHAGTEGEAVKSAWLNQHDAETAPKTRQDGKLVRIGWLWRRHPGNSKWTFTRWLDKVDKYGPDAEFIPLYAEKADFT